MKRFPAFSLIEVSVALAIAGIVVATASSIVVQMNAGVRDATIRLQADEEAKLLGEWFIFQMRGLGGDDLRPWDAVSVENNCAALGDLPACGGGDRVTVTNVDPDFTACSVKRHDGINLESDLKDAPPLGNGDGTQNAGDTCCFNVFQGAAVGTSPWENRRVLVFGAGPAQSVNLTSRVNAGPDSCAMQAPSLPAGSVTGSFLMVATQKIYFRSPVTTATLVENGFYEFEDKNGDNLFDPGELLFLTDNVFDFQVALGYDHDGDGHVVEDGTTADEWLFNAAGDVLPPGAVDESLRQVAVGFIVGVPVTSDRPPTAVTVLDGASRSAPRTHLRGTVTHATLRNIFLFD